MFSKRLFNHGVRHFSKPAKKILKDPNKPTKVGTNPYTLFCQEKFSSFENETAQNTMRKLAELWRELPPEDKQSFQERAARNSEIYKERLFNYDSSEWELKVKEHPRPPRSGYNYFVKDHYASVKEENKDKQQKDVMAMLGNKWSTLDEISKENYRREAKEKTDKWKAMMGL